MKAKLDNYDPKIVFFQQYKNEIETQLASILEYKHSPDNHSIPPQVQHGTMRLNKSDRHSRFVHMRDMLDVIPLSHHFEGRNVIDVGAGFGSMYYPIRFGQPAKIIAVDPNRSNHEFIGNLGYDDTSPFGWENYPFKSGDFVFIRNTWLPDWKAFAATMMEKNVSDVMIVQAFIDIDEVDVFQHFEPEDCVPCRWTYNKTLENYTVPTCQFVIKAFNDSGYGVVHQSSRMKSGLKRIYRLLFTKVGK